MTLHLYKYFNYIGKQCSLVHNTAKRLSSHSPLISFLFKVGRSQSGSLLPLFGWVLLFRHALYKSKTAAFGCR